MLPLLDLKLCVRVISKWLDLRTSWLFWENIKGSIQCVRLENSLRMGCSQARVSQVLHLTCHDGLVDVRMRQLGHINGWRSGFIMIFLWKIHKFPSGGYAVEWCWYNPFQMQAATVTPCCLEFEYIDSGIWQSIWYNLQIVLALMAQCNPSGNGDLAFSHSMQISSWSCSWKLSPWALGKNRSLSKTWKWLRYRNSRENIVSGVGVKLVLESAIRAVPHNLCISNDWVK